MDTICIPRIGRGSSPGPNMSGTNVVLQGGITKIVIGGRICGGNEIGGEGVSGRGVGVIACVGVVRIRSRLIGSSKKVLGRKRSYGAQNPTLGRLGPRIG
jgi:hypothetical protein